MYPYVYWNTINCEASLRTNTDSFALPDGYYVGLVPISISRNWSFQGPIRKGSRATRGGCVRDEGSCSSNFPHPRRITCCSAPNSRPPATKALHTICGNNTSIVSSSWWWAYKCPKHVEQIISAINHPVATSWFSSLRIYTMMHGQTYIIFTEIKSTWLENVRAVFKYPNYVILGSDTALRGGKWCLRIQCRILWNRM